MEVKIKGHFYENGGYSKVNRNLALGLRELGVDVKIEPTNKVKNNFDKELDLLNKRASRDAICIDSIVPTLGLESFGKYRILYTTIETNTLDISFINFTNNYNEIWVTSDFCKKVLEKYINRPIYVIPDTIDINNYREEGEKYNFKSNLNPFVFVSVFGWSYRKGPDVLLRSYLQEFNREDPVTLLISSRYNNRENNKNIIKDFVENYIKKYGGNSVPHIVRFSKNISEEDMAKLYRLCNSFCLFSRGEGFGLPYCEASLSGLPIIGTNFSGHTMFLNKNNSYLLDVDDILPLPSGTMHVSYWDNLEMARLKDEKTIKNAGKLMREVFENYKEAKNKNKKLKEYIMSNYSIEHVSKLVYDRLLKIVEKFK